jgi:EthD domain
LHSVVVLSSRPSDWTRDRFIGWWRGPHADSAKKIPGLLDYRHGVVEGGFGKLSDGWDAYARLAFADRESLDRALASDEWAAAIAETDGMGGRVIAVITSEIDLLAGSDGS